MSLRTDFPELRVGRLCELFGMTKQAYYQSISRKCDAESNDELILQLVAADATAGDTQDTAYLERTVCS